MGQNKSIDIVGTGDFTHPAWYDQLKAKLTSAGNGFYKLKSIPQENPFPAAKPLEKPIYFCLTSEVCTIYTHKGKVRKVHHLLFADSFNTVQRLNQQLAKVGDLAADGRPILHISARNLLEIVCETSPRCHLIPAHIWTPWFALFGSKSGYDAIQEAFEDLPTTFSP